MANQSIRGLRPVGTLTGASWSESIRWYPCTTGALIGRFAPVILDTTGNVNCSSLDTAPLANLLGVAVVFERITGRWRPGDTLNLAGSEFPKLSAKHHAVGDGAMYVGVVVDPNVIYEVQASGVVGAVTNVGATCNILDPAGVDQGLSNAAINVTSLGVSADAALKIVDIPYRVDNDLTLTNAKFLVVINKSLFAGGVAGI